MPFIDDFTGPDGQDLLDRPGWEEGSRGSVADKYVIYQNGVSTASGLSREIWCPDQGDVNCYVFGQWPFDSNNSAALFYYFRCEDLDNTLALRKQNQYASGVEVRQRVGAVETVIVDGRPDDSGPELWLRAEVEGLTVRVFSGGTGVTPGPWVEFMSGTCDASLTGTRHGISCSTNFGGTRLLNRYFEAGALGAPPAEPAKSPLFFGQDF